jgi:hypothetical protein
MPININTYCRINRNGSININTDPTFPLPIDPNFLCANGAGTPEINGTYKFYDFYTYPFLETRPRYIPINNVDLSGIQIFAGPTFSGDFYRWVFFYYDGDRGNYYYRGNTDPAPEYPWLETSWSVYDIGVGPVPTVNRGPC